MAYIRETKEFRQLSNSELASWRLVPPAVASDCMNRGQAMSADMKPVTAGLKLCGQARTVAAMAGDCGSISELIDIAAPGEIIVVDAGGVRDTAVWGGIMTLEAKRRELGGAVIYGAVRDISDIRQTGFSMFACAAVPRGPHHGFGGTIDGAISAAGVPVAAGDIVLGDDDGVVIVPLNIAAKVLELSLAHLKKEEHWIAEMSKGTAMSELFPMPHSAAR